MSGYKYKDEVGCWCVKDGVTKYFTTIPKMADFIGVETRDLKNAIGSGKSIKGYKVNASAL